MSPAATYRWHSNLRVGRVGNTGTIGAICDKDATNFWQRANGLIRVGSALTLPIRLRHLCNSLLHDQRGDTFRKGPPRYSRDTVATIGDALAQNISVRLCHTLEKTMTKTLQPPPGYAALLKDIKERVRTAQVRAALAVNRELILLYWSIGRDILDRQKLEGWGLRCILHY